MSGDDPLSFFAASENRVTLLSRLCEAGAASREECYDWLDASRRTVTRALADLTHRDWVREREGTYRVTALGEQVAAAHESVRERVAVLDHLRPLLRAVPSGAFDLDPRHLADAEVLVADESRPCAAMDRVLELRRGATRMRELSSVVTGDSVGQLADRLATEDLDAEVVLARDALASARSNPDYAEGFAATRDAGGLALYVRETVPFLLAVLDETVALGVTEGGVPTALVVSDEPAVREWATETFADHRDAAERVA